MRATGTSVTQTLVDGLRLVLRAQVYQKALALRGKVHLDVDLRTSRERNRR